MKHPVRAAGALVGAGLLIALAGCASSAGGATGADEWTIPDEDPTATIRVLSILDPEKDGMQPVLDAFAEAHPTITVEYESVPFDQLNSVLEARISNKDGNPDVYWADMPRIAALTARGYTTDLTEQFAPHKDAWDTASYDGSSVDGTLQAVPIANSTQLLFYNKGLLDAAGLAYPSDDPAQRITWEQIAEDAAAAVAAGAPNGLVFAQVDRYYQLEALPVSLGGSPGGTGEGNLTPDIESDAWVEAFDWYGSIFESGISPRGIPVEQNDPNFVAGLTAYQVDGPWLLPMLQDSDVDWGVAAHPVFEGAEPVTATGSWAIAMNPFSKEKEAAAIFMKWMSVDDGGGYITHRTSPELPANIEGKVSYYEREVFSSPEGEKAAKIIDFETSNTAVNRLSTVGYVEFEEVMGRAFSDIRNGADAKSTLESAAAELEVVWAPYKD